MISGHQLGRIKAGDDLTAGAGIIWKHLHSYVWSGKRLKKTRKYDIITTPAERVEMAPLNEEDDEDEDSTVFDIKYRYSGNGSSVHFGQPRQARHVFLFPGRVSDLGVCCLRGSCSDPYNSTQHPES
uniref:Family with sequence similarity 174 member B n=1 Tax=Molossus molossus TaxID=27622 RepID=A0A7J8BKD2_MOLMO|nr:family with sequence similarity 174 member B [Molossus molossus]